MFRSLGSYRLQGFWNDLELKLFRRLFRGKLCSVIYAECRNTCKALSPSPNYWVAGTPAARHYGIKDERRVSLRVLHTASVLRGT